MKTKLPKATRLPSGSFRCQVTAPGGKRISVTAETAREAQAKAVAIKAGIMESGKKGRKKTLSQAIDEYIGKKSNILSPSTILHYRSMKKLRFSSLMGMDVEKITKSVVQEAINREVREVSPKTVKNAYGLIRPVLKECGIDVFGVTLPRIQPPEISTIDIEEIAKLFNAVRGNKYELEILLALWLGLRRSEILGLCWDAVDLDRSQLEIKRVYTQGSDGGMVLVDDTKTIKSRRVISLPSILVEKFDSLPRREGRIFNHSENVVTRELHKICEREGISDTTLHALRHTNAAIMRYIGISDAHAMKRGGWTSEKTYKDRYSYVFTTVATEEDLRLNDYMERLHNEK